MNNHAPCYLWFWNYFNIVAVHSNFFILISAVMQATSPGDNTVHTVKGTSGDKFEFKAPRSGMYKFCFHNPYATPETVSFYIHVGHIPSEHDLAKDGLLISLLLVYSYISDASLYIVSGCELTAIVLQPCEISIAYSS